MERAHVAVAEISGEVVHLVGRVTDTVFSFLGPATAALADRGFRQTVILLDDPRHRDLLPQFHASVRLVLMRSEGGILERHLLLTKALRTEMNRAAPLAVHLHGIIPGMLGVYAARRHGLKATLYFSPHGSKSLGPMKASGAVLLWLLRHFSGQLRQHAIANVAADARTLQALTKQSVQLIESPVHRSFLAVERREARRPLMISGSHLSDPRCSALFAQLAVLLADEAPGLSFNWIGTADAESLARLEAANVGVWRPVDGRDRAARLAAGWVYFAPGGSLGFPVMLAEAMAAGLPCVAWDTPYHRDVLRDGETGFLCNSMAGVLLCITRLMESPELRARMGAAARSEAARRFDDRKFGKTLLAAYRQRIIGP